ncbi:hypothetical protein ACFE04_007957 [Oxalis oulophora]
MFRSSDYPVREQRYYGWGAPSNDYHSHLTRIEKMPSVIADAPKYPNVYKAFNNGSAHQQEAPNHHNHIGDHHQTPIQKKVHISEKVETISCDMNGNCQVIEESVDMDADGFIEQKHKGFELCKWNTFKKH